MKKNLFLLILISACCRFLSAQSTTPTVLASGGNYFSAGGNSLSITVGEMSAIETFSSATNFLTQGFQQPEASGVGIQTQQLNDLEFVSFPNPAHDFLTVYFSAPNSGRLKISVYDALGKETQTQLEEEVAAGEFTTNLLLSELPSGFYFLHVQFQNSDGSFSEAVHKISIIQ